MTKVRVKGVYILGSSANYANRVLALRDDHAKGHTAFQNTFASVNMETFRKFKYDESIYLIRTEKEEAIQ